MTCLKMREAAESTGTIPSEPLRSATDHPILKSGDDELIVLPYAFLDVLLDYVALLPDMAILRDEGLPVLKMTITIAFENYKSNAESWDLIVTAFPKYYYEGEIISVYLHTTMNGETTAII